jgi:hypothetical protein
LTFFACHKEKQTAADTTFDTKYDYIQQSIKPFEVKTNSYWVYKNDSTGVQDSISVLSTETGMIWTIPQAHGQGGGTQSEYYKINLKSFSNNTFYNDYILDNFMKRNGGGTWGEKGQPIYMANSVVGTIFNGMEISSKLNTLNINGITFNNITKVKITTANQIQPEFSNDTYLYYVDTVGLIKKEIVLGLNNIESWSIKHWKIVK